MSLSRWQTLSIARIGNAVLAAGCTAKAPARAKRRIADGGGQGGLGHGAIGQEWRMPALLNRSVFIEIGPMRNIPAVKADSLPGRMVVTGNEYPERHKVPRHRHRRSQFLYAANGIMVVATDAGRWIVPPERAVWIPAGVHHEVFALGPVSTRSLYVDPDVSASLPDECRVLGVAPLVRHLLLAAVDLPLKPAKGSRAQLILELLVREIERAPVLPLDVPFP